ncbi:MAG: hypothetical protein GY775_16890 [Candidatus Scalindua sp.]|nr:hypothetical protein [Candidatus Scalindua sp.]
MLEFKLREKINILFNNKRVCKEVGISVDGRKKIRIRDLDKKETVKQVKSANRQENAKIKFEYDEMNKRYSFQKK